MRVAISPLSLFLALLLGSACAPVQKTTSYTDDARKAYDKAMSSFESEDCITAEPQFRDIRANYPYTRYAALSELREADCLAMQDKHAEAIEIYQRFARVRASHEQVPYARFKAAESQYEQVPSEWFISPPAHERDLRAARDALKDLRRYLLDFPDDENAVRAAEMEQKTLALLARHELYVADFYLTQEKGRAAISRLRDLLRSYEGSGYEPQALLLMGRTQLMMKDREAAHATFRELIARYPESGSAVQAEHYLAETGG
ncbi:MAG: outer membrane protein assembly factor BamD [Polyangiales bacterium]